MGTDPGDSYKMIDASYAHGLMNGEAVKFVEDGVSTWRSLKLCDPKGRTYTADRF